MVSCTFGYGQVVEIFSDQFYLTDMVPKGDTMYVTGSDCGICWFDMTDSQPTLESATNGLGGYGLALHGSYLYYTYGFPTGGVRRIPIDVEDPVPEVLITGLSEPNRIVVSDNAICVSTSSGGYQIECYDRNELAADPEVIPATSYVKHLALRDHRLYYQLSQPAYLYAVDTSNFTGSPELIFEKASMGSFALTSNYIYYGVRVENHIRRTPLGEPPSNYTILATGAFRDDDLVIANGDIYYLRSDFEGALYRLENVVRSSETSDLPRPRIFPNPVRSELRLFDVPARVSYKIYDFYGRLVQQGRDSQTTLLLTDLPAGTYLLSVEGMGTVEFLKHSP